MAMGIRVRDGANSLIFDSSDRLTRVLGVIAAPGGSHTTVANNGFLTGEPFCVFLRQTDTVLPMAIARPTYRLEGNVLHIENALENYFVVYGVF